MSRLLLSERAHEHWGSRIADQYVADLDAALGLLANDLSLLRERHDDTGRLRFYRVREAEFVAHQIEDRAE